MGARSCMIIFFPYLGTLVAIALAIVAILGSNPKARGLDGLYFMRINFSNVTADGIQGITSQQASLITTAIQQFMKTLGISQFYDAGITGYCEGNFNNGTSGATTVTHCASPVTPFWFDLQTYVENELNVGFTLTLPSDVQNYENILKAASKAMWVCYIVAIIILGISLFTGLIAFRSRLASCCTAIISLVGAVLLVLSSALATGIFVTYRHYFNQEAEKFGIQASLGTTCFILTWIASAAALWACLWWIFSICCSPKRHGDAVEEKQPFIGYIPRRQRHYY